jgi:hypothetical protein
MYAFVLVHFGSNIKYLEYEIYLLLNLKQYTKCDILYLYSINDTPDSFIKIISKFCDNLIPYDDNEITYNIKFNSAYKHFTLLRTCNFIFAYKLKKYKKVCLIESDMIIDKDMDDIFKFKTPAILINVRPNILSNYKLKKSDTNFNKLDTNGGIILIKPSNKKFKKYLKNINVIIENEFMYPNETLFIKTNKTIYNIPYAYNVNAKEYDIIRHVTKYSIHNIMDYVILLHFKVSVYKHIDIIRDGYLEEIKDNKPILYYFISKYKKEYYDKYSEYINELLKSIK